MSVRIPAMPYFEFVLDRLAAKDARDQAITRAWSRHLHLGYWESPGPPDLSPEGHQRAMDDLAREHFVHAGIAPGMRVADVGCGLGGTMSLLNDAFDRVDLVGVNIDPRQLEHARAAVSSRPGSHNRVDFLQADACALPFEDASVDVVLSVECIFHFASKLRYFREVRRVLRPGGRFVFSDLVVRPAAVPLLILLYLPLRAGVRGTYGDCRPPVTRGSYRRLAARTGFEPRVLKDVTRGTLPNYELLPRLMTQFDEAETFRRGVRFLEYASRLGFYTYDVVTLCAPASASDARAARSPARS